MIDVPVAVVQEDESVETEWRSYPIRYGSNLDVDLVEEITRLDLERMRLQRKKNVHPHHWAALTSKVKKILNELVREQTPNAPPIPVLLDEVETVLAAMMGNVSPVTAVAEALADEHPGRDDPGAGEPGNPTRSPRPSRRRSRSSGTSTGGTQAGGDGESDGATSDERSASSTGASAS